MTYERKSKIFLKRPDALIYRKSDFCRFRGHWSR